MICERPGNRLRRYEQKEISMTRRFYVMVVLTLACLLTTPGKSQGYVGVVDNTYGAQNNLAGIGRFVEEVGGPAVALWDLRATVENTDFDNALVQGGTEGIQYVMNNSVFNSQETNIITFNVNPIDQANPMDDVIPTISLTQSPYNNTTTWNGGNIPGDISQFRMSWEGGGTATIRDADDQLDGLDHNTVVPSGTWVRFTDYQLRNSEDSWRITLPQGVSQVRLNWNSSNPMEASDLTHEWITFNANFSPDPNALPEPDSATLLALGSLAALGLLRRRRMR